MNAHPRYKAVYALAARTASALGIPIPAFTVVTALFRQQNPLPQVYCLHDARLWVDAHYIAYTRSIDDGIHYVFVTDKHIEEERRSYETASALRRKHFCLPQDIRNQFVAAEEQMRQQQKRVAVFDIVDKKLQ